MPKLTPQNLPGILRLNANTYPHMAEVLNAAADFISEIHTPGFKVFESPYDGWVAVYLGDERLKHISGCSETAVGALHECIVAIIGAMEILETE